MSGPHFVGFFGTAPGDAASRSRRALDALGVTPATSAELPGLFLGFGPSQSCTVADVDGQLVVLAGWLFSDDEPSSAPDRRLTQAVQRWEDRVPHELRFEGALLGWDIGTRSGYVARDHLGHGSLYWASVAGGTAFATELRLLLDILDARPAPSTTGIALWLGLDVTRPDVTLYEGIRQVPSGQRLVLAPDGVRVEAYWRPEYTPPMSWSIDEAVEELRPIVRRAVRRRVSEGARVGVLLSGGLDSGSVAAFSHALGADVTAYSGVFPGQRDHDESPWIDQIVEALKIDSVRAVLKPQGVLTSLVSFARRWSLPTDGSGYWWEPLLRQPAADGITTILTGDGGDEIFDARLGLIADRLRRGRLISAYRLARTAPNMWCYPPPQLVVAVLRNSGVAVAFPALRHQRSRAPHWLAPWMVAALHDAHDGDGAGRLPGPRWWSGLAYHVTTRLPAIGMLPLNRREGETAGCRVSAPLLDVDLVEAMLRCPPGLGFRGTLSKPILRAIGAGYVPDGVRLRLDKTVFSRQFREGVELESDGIARMLSDPAAEIRAYVDHDAVDRDLDALATRQSPDVFPLYRLAALECWLRHERDPSFGERGGFLPWEFTISRRNALAD